MYAPSGARTHDLWLIRPSLYQLSYKSLLCSMGFEPMRNLVPTDLKSVPLDQLGQLHFILKL